MMQAEEKCLRCGQTVMYITNEDGTFCPQCGWSREAARNYANNLPKQIGGALLKSMLKGTGFLLIAIILVWLSFEQARRAFLLGTQGRESVATVVSLDRTSSRHNTFRGRVYTYDYTISFAGHQAKWATRENVKIGKQFWLIFYPKDPSINLPGRETDSTFALVTREYGITGTLLLPVVILFAIGGFIKYIRSGIRVLLLKHSFESDLTKNGEE